MTSRERILAALNHDQPDRPPIDLGGHRSSGIMAIAYKKLKDYLGIKTGDVYVYDVIQQLAIVEPPVLDEFGVDVVELGRGFLTDEADWKEWHLPDGTPCKIPAYVQMEKRGDDWLLLNKLGRPVGIQKKGCLYFEQLEYPLANRNFAEEDFSDLEKHLGEGMWSVPSPGGHLSLEGDDLKRLAEGAKKLRDSTDRAVVGLFGGNLFETPQSLYRMDNYLTYLMLCPEQCLRLSEKLTEIYLHNLEKYLSAVGSFIDVILFGDDLGRQNGPLISPEMYREFYKPFHRKMWRRVKELADVKIMLHSCGSVEPFLDDLIDAGLDAVNPVQITAAGMDARILKEKYGERLTFWGGGCDTQRILPYASTEEVRAHVRRQVSVLYRGGGFVFQQVHNIMANVPPQNIAAMFQEINRRVEKWI
ncbi:MAG: methyltransferase [candidate division KSB1 bacterium]|nr:methyltransferase [candidate division KSB1 bacterium]